MREVFSSKMSRIKFCRSTALSLIFISFLLITVYQESFAKENVHRFCKSCCIHKHFLVIMSVITKNF